MAGLPVFLVFAIYWMRASVPDKINNTIAKAIEIR